MAAANTPLGELWVLGAPVFLAREGLLWIFAAITLIEGVVLSLVLRIPLLKGLGIAMIVNAVSSLAGAFLYLAKCVVILAVILLIAILDVQRNRQRIGMSPLVIPGIFLALFISSAIWVDVVSGMFGSFDVRTRLMALIPACAISILIEFVVHALIDNGARIRRIFLAWAAANIVSYPLLALVFLMSPFPDFMSPGANIWNAAADVKHAIGRGDLDRAIDHSDTLRAISRQEPLLYDYTRETPLRLARALKSAGRHRQALMLLAEFPLPEDSRLHSAATKLQDEILTHLRSTHPNPPPPNPVAQPPSAVPSRQ